MMINEIVAYGLEIVFGGFLFAVLAKKLFGIDIMDWLARIYNKVVYGIDINNINNKNNTNNENEGNEKENV